MVMEKAHVIGIDPGRRKYGIAVMTATGRPVLRRVVPVESFDSVFSHLLREYRPQVVVVGDRTSAEQCLEQLQNLIRVVDYPVQIETVSEHRSSEEGRRRYLIEHRKGWRRLVPLGLQWPKEPYDDYVAEVLVLRYLQEDTASEDM
ncbi:MAG: pre-16S rRNA-processing nuclease YqgF [Firmicutes bacterium]|jgi:RNase H-fold protein (predicted Holliday junction resolvase)|nr:pre-16S rRNA-processing nuclease YqgF [Bacillota bacterium]